MLAAQSIMCGDNDVVIAGGMENMSAVPHFLGNGRNGQKLGDMKLIDGLVKDGLTDVYNKVHMGNCAEVCASEMNFSREQQDSLLSNHTKKCAAWEAGKFADEIVPVKVPQEEVMLY